MLQNKLKTTFLALAIIPTFTFATQCTQDDRMGLKENGYSQKEIVELCGEEQKIVPEKGWFENSYITMRVGLVSQSSNYSWYEGDVIQDEVDNISANGTEISVVFGIDNKEGFDFRGIVL